jgi:hypothetical protein
VRDDGRRVMLFTRVFRCIRKSLGRQIIVLMTYLMYRHFVNHTNVVVSSIPTTIGILGSRIVEMHGIANLGLNVMVGSTFSNGNMNAKSNRLIHIME